MWHGIEHDADAHGSRRASSALQGISSDEGVEYLAPVSLQFRLRFRWCGTTDQGACDGEPGALVGVGQETVVADADESSRKDVEEKPLGEAGSGQRECPAATCVSSVCVAERDVSTGDSLYAAIADGDAMGVSPEVAEHLAGTGHRSLGVDDPRLCGSVAKRLGAMGGGEAEGLVEFLQQLGSKDEREFSNRQEELLPCRNPSAPRRG